MSGLQLFDALPAHIEAALTESISRFGVLVPVAKCQHGVLLDGHHRSRIAADLGVTCPEIMHLGDDSPGCGPVCAEIARTLNSDRRHLTDEQRKAVVLHLAQQVDEHGIGLHSPNAIADAVGVDEKTVRNDLATSDQSEVALPGRRRGLDGRVRPASRPKRPPVEEVAAEAIAEFPFLGPEESPGLPPEEVVRLAEDIRDEPEGDRERAIEAAKTWHKVYDPDPEPDSLALIHNAVKSLEHAAECSSVLADTDAADVLDDIGLDHRADLARRIGAALDKTSDLVALIAPPESPTLRSVP